MATGHGFPRASWTNLLASSPLVITGLKSSATAVETGVTANQAASTSGAGVSAAGILLYDFTGAVYKRFASSRSLADADAGADSIPVSSLMFNGATYDRVKTANAMRTTSGVGLLGVGILGYDGTNWQSPLCSTLNASDGVGVNIITMGVANYGSAFNSSAWDRLRNSAAANLAATTQPYQLGVAEPGEWSVTHTPAAATQATATKASGGGSVRHVCRSITASYSSTAVGGGAPLQVNVRDGASGAGTILRSWLLGVGVTNGSATVDVSGLNLLGAAATAMTIEFAGAGAANTNQTVSMSGYSTT